MSTVVTLAQRWNIRAEDDVLPTPPDGFCFFYDIMATGDQSNWCWRVSPLGFQSDRDREQAETRLARQWKTMLIDRYIAAGQLREASRLSQAGSAGYQTDENLFTLTALLNTQIELLSLSHPDVRTIAYGEGALVRIGHMVMIDPCNAATDHFVCLRAPQDAVVQGLPVHSSLG